MRRPILLAAFAIALAPLGACLADQDVASPTAGRPPDVIAQPPPRVELDAAIDASDDAPSDAPSSDAPSDATDPDAAD